MSGIIKLSQDIETLINNRQGSDIQFKVGGYVKENGETIYDESATTTLYAHSNILRCRSRYFATMLDEEKNWKESSNGIIYKPNISPKTFQDVLHYIYTGKISTLENIMELIAAADEMDLEDLSVQCQNEIICIIKHIFSDENDNNDKNEIIEETLEGQKKYYTPIDVAIHNYIIPVLNLANSHPLSHLSKKLLEVILPNISVIIKSPDAYTRFIDNISSEALTKIIASDNLAMTERNIWDLALGWACHQTNLPKVAVEARLANIEDDNEDDNETISCGAAINSIHLNRLKKTLTPLLPVIRFSLLDPNDYKLMVDTLSYLLPRRRFSEINRFFLNIDNKKKLDAPRIESFETKTSSKIVVESATWEFLRKEIFETDGIADCPSFEYLRFNLLYRASEHDFLARTFHQLCDDKGPTLTLVKSADGHLFGGVNFAHWKSDNTKSSNSLNFLFALPDGHHRKNTLIFQNIDSFGAINSINMGPYFMSDLCIRDSANIIQNSYSCLPYCYNGNEASGTALAGYYEFRVSDYEVFAISKK